MTNKDSLESEFVKHVLKYRPDSITARLAKEVAVLRRALITQKELERRAHKHIYEELITLVKS